MSTTIEQEAFPLSWPLAWPRTKFPGDSRFGTHGRSPTVARARETLNLELGRLGASRVVVSTNIELRRDGQPYSNRRDPSDSGVAVYFTLKGVRDGRKLRTMRPKRRNGKRPALGDRISLRHWVGSPYRSGQAIIHNSTVKTVSTVVIQQGYMPLVDGRLLTAAEAVDFARYDGFEDYADMQEWFAHEHGQRVELDMIEWEPQPEGGR